MLRYAKNARLATEFIEYLSSPKAQKIYTDLNFEYPANPIVKPNDIIYDWGSYKENLINLSTAGKLQSAAIKLNG